MKLVKVDAMLARLSLPSGDAQLEAALDSAIRAASPALEATLQTKFDYGERTHVFHLNPLTTEVRGGLITLKLGTGFMVTDGADAPLVVYADTAKDSLQSTAQELVADDGYFAEPEKGFVKVSEDLLGKFVRVTYHSGFNETDEVPEWLSEACIAYSVRVLSTQQIGDPKPELGKVFKFMADHGTIITDGHLRLCPYAVLPVL